MNELPNCRHCGEPLTNEEMAAWELEAEAIEAIRPALGILLGTLSPGALRCVMGELIGEYLLAIEAHYRETAIEELCEEAGEYVAHADDNGPTAEELAAAADGWFGGGEAPADRPI